MKINDERDKTAYNGNYTKYYKEIPVQAKQTNQYKNGSYTPGTKGGSKSFGVEGGKLGKGYY